MTNSPSIYETWSREELIARLLLLDRPKPTTPKAEQQNRDQKKQFNFSSHARRKIALKFCYSGWEYGGLAFQNVKTPLPTVEGVLFDALAKARLIDPDVGFEGCGWEKCGRTDRGVSAAGQVISLWVRSALGTTSEPGVIQNSILEDSIRAGDHSTSASESTFPKAIDDPGALQSTSNSRIELLMPDADSAADLEISTQLEPSSNPVSKPAQSKIEHDYSTILNRLLPPTIRILAWSPVSPTFSARFACQHRHYKYFFPSVQLDIPAMREAAAHLIGEHDFRNLCKLDPAKQITQFHRRILRADIEPVGRDLGETDGDIYVFNLVGTAFLYHQVRHIMAILFLVGSGLEAPSIIKDLMNIELVNRKPEYQMADALPLMLWDCAYPAGEVTWNATGADSVSQNARVHGSGDLYHQIESIHSRSQIYTTLDRYFLAATARHHAPPPSSFPLRTAVAGTGAMNVPLGGGTFKRTGKYVPVLRRSRLDTVEAINERWLLGKGHRKDERRKLASADEDE